jgi:hypothetical protein
VEDGKRKAGMELLRFGIWAFPCSCACPITAPGLPTNWKGSFCRPSGLLPSLNGLNHGLPKPILKPHSTQTTRTSEKPEKAMSMVFTAHLRWTSPP